MTQTAGDPATRATPLVALLAMLYVAAQFATGWRYGLFRDEFYYLACADHLDWGYVDHPPLSIAVLAGVRALLGDSLFAVRLVPALLGAGLIVIAARIAGELGGGRFAQALTALCVLVAPQFLGQGSYYSMNSFDLVFWALAALLVARIARTGDARLWLPLGVVLGLALLNKIGVLVFGAGLAVGLVVTPLRRHLRRPHPWLAAAIATALAAPYVLWQVRHEWPTLEFMRNAAEHKIATLTPWRYFTAQLPEIHPLNALVWLVGLGWLLASHAGRRWRALGVIYVVAFVVFALQHSKPYYLGPAYPMLLAAGAVALEGWTSARATWLRPAFAGALGVTGALIAPLVLPVLPVETLVAYQRALGQAPATQENQSLGALSQFFADRFGWHELTAAVVSVYEALPPEERAGVRIVTRNYGEAGALRYYGRAHGLPRAVSQHNNFYLWGPGPGDARVFIVVGQSAESLRDSFASVQAAARVEAPYAMPYETRHPIHVCRGLKRPLMEAWQRGRHYI